MKHWREASLHLGHDHEADGEAHQPGHEHVESQHGHPRGDPRLHVPRTLKITIINQKSKPSLPVPHPHFHFSPHFILKPYLDHGEGNADQSRPELSETADDPEIHSDQPGPTLDHQHGQNSPQKQDPRNLKIIKNN